jgi:hypothetical protein
MRRFQSTSQDRSPEKIASTKNSTIHDFSRVRPDGAASRVAPLRSRVRTFACTRAGTGACGAQNIRSAWKSTSWNFHSALATVPLAGLGARISRRVERATEEWMRCAPVTVRHWISRALADEFGPHPGSSRPGIGRRARTAMRMRRASVSHVFQRCGIRVLRGVERETLRARPRRRRERQAPRRGRRKRGWRRHPDSNWG